LPGPRPGGVILARKAVDADSGDRDVKAVRPGAKGAWARPDAVPAAA